MPASPAPADPGRDDGLAWPDRDPMTAAEREASLDRLCEQADVPRLTVHQLRHQCASLLFASGADVKTPPPPRAVKPLSPPARGSSSPSSCPAAKSARDSWTSSPTRTLTGVLSAGC